MRDDVPVFIVSSVVVWFGFHHNLDVETISLWSCMLRHPRPLWNLVFWFIISLTLTIFLPGSVGFVCLLIGLSIYFGHSTLFVQLFLFTMTSGNGWMCILAFRATNSFLEKTQRRRQLEWLSLSVSHLHFWGKISCGCSRWWFTFNLELGFNRFHNSTLKFNSFQTNELWEKFAAIRRDWNHSNFLEIMQSQFGDSFCANLFDELCKGAQSSPWSFSSHSPSGTLQWDCVIIFQIVFDPFSRRKKRKNKDQKNDVRN